MWFIISVFVLALSTASADRCSNLLQQIFTFNANISSASRDAKFQAMSADIGSFFRGADHIWLRDLLEPVSVTASAVPINWQFSNPKTKSFLSGDQHLFNYGAYGNADGAIVYYINDYDETFIGDFQIDLWRTATSIVIHSVANGLASADTQTLLQKFSQSYLDTLSSYVKQPDLINNAIFDSAHTYGRLNDFLASVASTQSRAVMLKKYLVDPTAAAPAFDLTKHGLGPVDPTRFAQIQQAWASYGQSLSGSIPWSPSYFAIKASAARVVAGLGSIGLERYFVLIEADSSANQDDRILDIKFQPEPMWWPYLSPADIDLTMRHFRSQAERVVGGYRAIDRRVDPLLGWFLLPDGTSFSVRELSPWKADFDIPGLTTEHSFENMALQWGAILATGHARAGIYNATYIDWNPIGEIVTVAGGAQSSAFVQLAADTATQYYQQLANDFNCFLNR